MNEIKTPEERNNPEKPSGRAYSEEWTKAWKQLEERVRQRPGPHLLVALAIGYLLQIIPFRSLLMLALRLCLILERPVLFLVCAFQLVKYMSRRPNSGAMSESYLSSTDDGGSKAAE
jgi:hypothetical protein